MLLLYDVDFIDVTNNIAFYFLLYTRSVKLVENITGNNFAYGLMYMAKKIHIIME